MFGKYQEALRSLYEQEPGRRDSIAPTGAQALMSLAQAEALDAHAAEVKAAAENILLGMQRHAKALTDAATASDRYAGRLVWATWALVLASVVLVVVTWVRG